MFEWVASVIESGGYVGIFFLMFLENIFPPIPSEIVLPLAGFAAADDALHIVPVVLVAALGALVGSFPWYMLGRIFTTDRLTALARRYGRIMTVSPRDIDQANDWFQKHGRYAVLLGRLVPTVRTLISVPAGIARMPIGSFLIYSAVGTAVWTTLLVGAGFVLRSEFTAVSEKIGVFADLVILTIVLTYLYRVLYFRSE